MPPTLTMVVINHMTSFSCTVLDSFSSLVVLQIGWCFNLGVKENHSEMASTGSHFLSILL